MCRLAKAMGCPPLGTLRFSSSYWPEPEAIGAARLDEGLGRCDSLRMATLMLPDAPEALPIAAVCFDAYGTLLDVHSAVAQVMAGGSASLEPARAAAFSSLWRDKQLAYTWLRNSMRRHADFAAVTADALDHAMAAHGLGDDAALRSALLAAYRRLAPFAEVPEVLPRLRAEGVALAVLSNGTPEMLAEGLASAGIAEHLDAVISVEDLGVFKPVPEVYALATRRFGVPARHILFISANGWDVHGAASFGCTVIHLNRQNAAAERLPGRAAYQLGDLAPLPDLFHGTTG
jgi:2-haloacid dehalogenase